jgi:hypothetical protein
MPQTPLTSDDLIYFGSQPVAFTTCPGSFKSFVREDWREDPSTLDIVVAREDFLPAGDGLTPDVILPAIPALDYTHRDPSFLTSNSNIAPSDLPHELAMPLIKIPLMNAREDTLRGVASGTRSALVKVDNEWFRLKGCGNNDEGFISRRDIDRKDAPGPLDEKGRPTYRVIRGSAFPHTALRELAVAADVGTAFQSSRSLGANIAVGMYLYTDTVQLPLGEAHPTACIVERTLGDRRLGSHVLSGLKILLPMLIRDDESSREALAALFPNARPKNDSKTGV